MINSQLALKMHGLALLLLMAVTPLNAAVILQYHHVSEDTPAATSVTPEQFEAHLDHLEQQGFRVLPLNRLVEEVRGGLGPSEKVAAITFDDGYRTVAETAIPMLEERGWTGSVFVTIQGIREGWNEMMAPAMLRDLHERGHLILNHTRSHPHMVRRQPEESEAAWRERMEAEITDAQRQLAEWLGEEPLPYLAWPYGEYDPALRALADELDYIAFGQQTGALGEYTDWQQVPRIPINRHYADWRSLSDKVNALPLPVLGTTPESGVTTETHPRLTLHLEGDWQGRVTCFAAGEPAQVTSRPDQDGTRLEVTSEIELSAGRHRYNCTAAAGQGRFHWYSWLWMRRPGTGEWYSEP